MGSSSPCTTASTGALTFTRGTPGREATITIDTLEVLAGSLPARAVRLVHEWATAHSGELEANWERARSDEPLEPIPPLPSMNAMLALIHVTGVAVVGDHRMRLTFEDGTQGDIDFSHWAWRGVFEPLRDPAYFREVTLDDELGTIVWPNGADIAPETLHAWALAGREPTAA